MGLFSPFYFEGPPPWRNAEGGTLVRRAPMTTALARAARSATVGPGRTARRLLISVFLASDFSAPRRRDAHRTRRGHDHTGPVGAARAGRARPAAHLFRGIGLWMIFLDHIPHDVVAWLTLRNYGFSDAAEFFVFISGYLVAGSTGRSSPAAGFSPR